MTQMYKLLIAVLARLIMIALGALFLYGASFYAALVANPDMRQLIATQGLDAGETSSKPLMLVAAIGTALAIVGLLLLVFGLRGLWRRIAAGMPSEDEGRAETSTGRLASVVIFGAGAVLALLRLTLLIYAVGDQLVLVWTGIETNAVVSRAWDGDWAPPGSSEPPQAGHQIEFSFETPAGETVRHETRVSYGLYRTLQEGSTIPVIYSPADPTDARLELLGTRFVLINAFIWVGLASVGLWGLRRNLGSGDSGGDERRAFVKPTPAPQTSIPVAPTRGGAGSPVRRQFGQRSL